MGRKRLDLGALLPLVSNNLRVVIRGGRIRGKVWQFRIFFPRWLSRGKKKNPIFSARDEELLSSLLDEHFGGCTSSWSFLKGSGRRGSAKEDNIHREITVFSACHKDALHYFRALRKELEACSGEEQILILREELTIV